MLVKQLFQLILLTLLPEVVDERYWLIQIPKARWVFRYREIRGAWQVFMIFWTMKS